ncbi:MAG: molybdopterin dinucleotide binding domain-containing protein, partial [Gammaproteobacteria bacterium]
MGAGKTAALFVADPSVGGGTFCNIGWLQELPRPFTKMTWDNAIHIAPADAGALGIRTGDLVRAAVGEHAIEAPVWVRSDHAEGAISLPLGYGRRSAGRVGNGVGFDA